ncbi:MAG TPA: GWxTD domain-containing protein [Bryobacteraceae bacterium]
MMVSWLSQTWVQNTWMQNLGWTLLHFLWQGTAIALLYAAARFVVAGRLSPQGRYILACAALSTMTAAPALTLVMLSSGAGAPSPGGGTRTAWWTISAAAGPQLLPWVAMVWFAGVLVFSTRLIIGLRLTRRLRSTAHPAPDEWQQVLKRLRGPGRSLRLLISSLVDVPVVVGWLKPVILVPVEFLAALPAGYITALLEHELAHVRRRDYLVNVLQSMAEALLFYHPAVWWISEQIRAERELCCDDLAVAASGDVVNYVRALAELETRQAARLKPALAADGGSLVHRIQRLLEPARCNKNRLPGPGAAWAMMLLWISGVGVAAMHAAPARAAVPAAASLSTGTPRNFAQSPAISPRSSFAELAGRARKTLLSDPILSAQLVQPQSPPIAVQAESRWNQWLKEDVAYIITPEERNAFLRLGTDQEREQFVEQFWLRRDPTPDTEENEFREEHYRRIAYANEQFASGVPGWKTDRGMIYIKYGPPDEREEHPTGGTYDRPIEEGGGTTTVYPFEKWRYRSIEGVGTDVNIEFVDPTMTGEYHMTMDPSEKDALTNVPGAGLTLYEQLGLASKADRFNRTDGTHLGTGNMPLPASMDQFTRLQQFINLQKPPQTRFKDLEAMVTSGLKFDLLPMKVRTDFIPVTNVSTMAYITIQFQNKDLQFKQKEGVSEATVNLYARIASMTRRPVQNFDETVNVNVPAEMLQQAGEAKNIYQKRVPLQPGRYRLDVAAKDLVGNYATNYEVILDVPRWDEDHLSASSLILADMIEKAPNKSIGLGPFAIGASRVRPRVDNIFHRDEKMGIYLQLYNFEPDEKTKKPDGTIQYEITKDGSSDKLFDLSEEAGQSSVGASQIVIEKSVPLRDLEPGQYSLKINATDKKRHQTVTRSVSFTIM